MTMRNTKGRVRLISLISAFAWICGCGSSESGSTAENAANGNGGTGSPTVAQGSASALGGSTSAQGSASAQGGSTSAQGSAPAQGGSTSAQGSAPAQGGSTSAQGSAPAQGSSPSASGGTASAGTTPVGSSCTSNADCQSVLCVNGTCTDRTDTIPGWNGAGAGFLPLTTGCPPSTKDECTGTCESKGGVPGVTVIRAPATLCFWDAANDATPSDPAATIEQVIESVNGQAYVHIRISFDTSFTDVSYGANAIGWTGPRGHTMDMLTKSDHTELLLTNGLGETVLNFKIDLLEINSTAVCGHSTAGVAGGDGAVIAGNASDVLAVSTSLHRNLNGCGYCTQAACNGDCKVNSPATDANYTPNPETPKWDYRQVYEVWIKLEAFGGQFGQAFITYTHSSPAKTAVDTFQVTGGPCPDTWTVPNGLPGEPTGTTCPPNYQIDITTESSTSCSPIPFAGWPNKTACPDGWTLDKTTEGRYCIKI